MSRRDLDRCNNASSWVRDLVQSTTPSAQVYGKVGYVKNSNHDCAIVKYAQAHYVVVALFGKEDLDPLLIQLDAIAQDIFSFRKDLFVPDAGRNIAGSFRTPRSACPAFVRSLSGPCPHLLNH